MTRSLLVLALLAVACRKEAPARPRPVVAARRVMAPPLASPTPEAPSLAMIPGHGGAVVPPAPDPSSGPLVAWDLVALDDGLGRDDFAWLMLTLRAPDGARRDLVNVGARGACREVSPPMLRDALRGGAPRVVSAVRTVQCDLPEPASFSLARDGDAWTVLRAGCVRVSRACAHPGEPDAVVGRVAVPGDVTARLAGPLARREEALPVAPGEPVSAPTETRLRWALEGAVRDGTAVSALNAALRFDGATMRRIDFGAATAVRAPTAAERGASDFVRGALAVAVIETLDEGPRHVSVTRQGDVVRIHAANPDATPGARPVIITQRVGLPPRGTLAVSSAPSATLLSSGER